jgi:hypothetical protein
LLGVGLDTCRICPNGFYNRNGTCQICPIFCQTCTLVGNSTRCNSCDAPLRYDDKSGTCNDVDNTLYTVALS